MHLPTLPLSLAPAHAARLEFLPTLCLLHTVYTPTLAAEADQGTEQLCQDLLQHLHDMPDSPTTAHKELYRELGAVGAMLLGGRGMWPQEGPQGQVCQVPQTWGVALIALGFLWQSSTWFTPPSQLCKP